MKILHIVHQYPPDFVGGTELHTRSLATGQQRAGHQVAVLTRTYTYPEKFRTIRQAHDNATFQETDTSSLLSTRVGQNFSGELCRDEHGVDRQTEDGVLVYRAWDGPLNPSKRYRDLFGNSALEAAATDTIRKFAPEIVHIQHLMGWPLSILSFLQKQDIPYVVTLHDFWWFCANAKLLTNYSDERCQGPTLCLNCTRCAVARAQNPAAWIAALPLWGSLLERNRLLRKGLDGARLLIAESKSVLNWHRQRQIAANKIRLQPTNLVLPRTFPVRHRNSDTDDNDTADVVRFLFVGGLDAVKGVHIVVDALKNVRGNVELHIAGDAADENYRAKLEQAANARIRLLGRLEREAVWQAYADCDAVVVPSLLHETFCMVAHEALAAGKPVLASDLAALPEAIDHGKNGLLVEAGNVDAWRAAMQTIVDDAGWRTRTIVPRVVLPTEEEMAEAVVGLYANARAGSSDGDAC